MELQAEEDARQPARRRRAGDGAGAAAMSPSAEPASEAHVARYLVPANLLGDSEIIVLAIKPSGWFVLTVSLPVIIAAVLAGVAGLVLGLFHDRAPSEAILYFCGAVGFGRVLVACWQWIGRTYVLTNLRVIVVRGLVGPQVQAAGLTNVQKVALSPTVAERMFAIGTVFCLGDPEATHGLAWHGVAHPREVADTIDEAVRRARGRGRGEK